MEFLAGLHGKIIHFPIALLIIYPIVEFAAFISRKDFFSKTALLFLFIGVLGAVVAALTGNQAFTLNQNLSDVSLDLFSNHELNANITLWLFTALLTTRYYLFVKKKLSLKFHFVILLIALSGMYFVYQTGHYGGELARQKMNDSYKNYIETISE